MITVHSKNADAAPHSVTPALFAALREHCEPGAFDALRERVRDYRQLTDDLTDALAMERKETVIMGWRREFRDAAAVFDRIYEANLGLIGAALRTFSGKDRAIDTDDMRPAAERGLMVAIALFDSDLGFAFSTFATRVIRSSISAHLASSVASEARHQARAFSLDAPSKTTDTAAHSYTADKHALSPFDALLSVQTSEMVNLVRRVVNEGAVLTSRERRILNARFDALSMQSDGDFEAASLQELADELSISRERVRQIEARALKKVAEFIGNYDYALEESSVRADIERRALRKKSPTGITLRLRDRLSLGVDLSTLTELQRSILALRLEGVTYASIARELDLARGKLNKQLSSAYAALKISTRVHPDDDLYREIPENARKYAVAWGSLTSFQRCVIYLEFLGHSTDEISRALGFRPNNVLSLLSDARKKLGIEPGKVDPAYELPPPELNVTEDRWGALTRLEKMVAWKTITVRDRLDKDVAKDLHCMTRSVSTCRYRAEAKLGINLGKERPHIRPPNAEFKNAAGTEAPPPGFARLEKAWGNLTPRQQLVMTHALQDSRAESISELTGLTVASVHICKSKAMKILKPLLTPAPQQRGITRAQWNLLTADQQRVARCRLDHPEWSAQEMLRRRKIGHLKSKRSAI